MEGVRKHLFAESFNYYSRYLFWGKAKPVEFTMGSLDLGSGSSESAFMKVPEVGEIESRDQLCGMLIIHIIRWLRRLVKLLA